MTTRSRLEAELATRRYTRRHAREIVTAVLGNNAGTVVATTDTRWCWIRLHGDANQVVRAWNTGFVPPVNNLPVDVEIVKGNGITDYQIVGVSINKGITADAYADATGMHALQHQRRDFNTGGYDPLDIYPRAIVQLRARAQATPDMTLYVEAGWYPVVGIATYFAGGNSPTFTAPGGGARCDLLYLDDTGTLQIVTGTVVVIGTPPRPAQPTATDLPLAYVYLTATTTTITEYIIEDARVVFGGGSAPDAPTTAEYVTLALDGSLSNERVLTPGLGLILTDNGANASVVLDESPFPNDPYTTPIAENGYAGNYTAYGYPNSEKRNAITSVLLGGTTYQVIGFWDADGYLVLGKRVLDAAWTFYTYNGAGGLPTISISLPDNHNIVSVGLDPNGFIHVAYDMHNSALLYRKSTAAVNAWTGALTATLAMLGTNEADVTYPTFLNDPAGILYFLFRDGTAPSGKSFFYKYNHGATTWAATTGSGAGGLIINGTGVIPTRGPYPFDPQFDSNFGAGGFFHIAWTWRINDGTSIDHDPAFMKWDGTNWTQAGGAAQTIPATPVNCAAIETASVVGQISLNADSNNRPHVVYAKTGADTYRHLYHAWYNGSSWVIRQITFTPQNASVDDGSTPLALSVHVLIDRSTNTVYVFYEDNDDAEGILLQRSAPNDFTVWTRFVVYPRGTGWWKPTSDVREWNASTIAYFPIAYWDGTAAAGAPSAYPKLPIRLLKWIPGTGQLFGENGTVDHGALIGLLDDDHTQYQLRTEKSAASGYASLDGTTKVPTAELGTGAANSTTFLRGDRSWASALGNAWSVLTDGAYNAIGDGSGSWVMCETVR